MTGRPSLRAFGEVARAGSVVAAAERLSVTPSAVSHLLADLESALGGVTLVVRRGRAGVALSEAGERLGARLAASFDAIDDAVAQAAHRPAATSALRLSVLTTFAGSWLVPRLGDFRTRHPSLRLMVATDTRPVDLRSEPFDAAVRWGRGDWDDALEATRLFDESLVAVASPALAAGATPAQWAALPRVEARSRPDDWPAWRVHAGVDDPGPARSAARRPALVFENRALATQAAVAGLGVLVADRVLVGDLLAQRLLVAAPVPPLTPGVGYWFVALRERLVAEAPLRSLRQWLLAQAAAAQAGVAAHARLDRT